ncbi:MAG: PhoU domain-containing protein [Candidatus Moduliflexus flocculans]|nr:PhoU domain-containing protein [Candidatus Moduliflexus flocculans]
MADMTIGMLRDAVQAFVTEDAELADRTIETEGAVDDLKARTGQRSAGAARARQDWSFEALNPWMQVTRRLERASDQARNICHEVIYMCTGQPTRHQGDADRAHPLRRRNARQPQPDGPGDRRAARPSRSASFASAGVEAAAARRGDHRVHAEQGRRSVAVAVPRALRRARRSISTRWWWRCRGGVKQALSSARRGGASSWSGGTRRPLAAGSPEAIAAAHEAAYARLEADVVRPARHARRRRSG